ncbi:MAG: cytochrome c oxidase subunit I [Brevundimonas sp.]|jgi:cytochrome c oxidase subunit I+III|uniref:cytochrome c oxidase subunit I n=1 Tax=Brevundimonas sp. TaxID=1871086 RepID=UPI00391C1518
MSEAPLSPLARHRAFERIYATPPGLLGRLSAVNHSVIGLRFIVTAFVFFLIGGVLSMLIRAQLAGSGTAFLDAPAYAQVFTMHGTVMMFLFAIPMIEGIALYMLPKLLGARDLAFPRLSAFGYWCYLFGGSILIIAMLAGVAPDAGWFMYTPLSSSTFTPGINSDVWLIGVTFVEVSAVCAAVEFMATVLKVRTDGMALNRMPIMVWYLWVTAAMMLFGFPPLILGSILLEIERAFGWAFFDPERGGHPLLWQHLFWLFGHPEVYIIFLPGAGIVSTLIPVFARTRLVGYGWIVCSLIALGFLSFGLWVHHMFTTGIPHLSLAFFSAASTLVAVPTAVQVFAWLATLLNGRPRLTLPMLYIYGFLFVFVVGGLTGVMLAVVPFDWQAHDTHFVVAHLHYVLIGALVFPMLAAAYHWLPHITGRAHEPARSHVAFWMIFGGLNLTFLPMHLTGLLGMPRRVHTYDSAFGWDWLNLISSIGGFVMTIGFALFVVDVIQQTRFGTRARRNLWGATTLEWAMSTPPPSYNIAAQPTVTSRDPLEDNPRLAADLAGGRGLLASPERGRMETLSVAMITGRPDAVIVLPGPSLWPLLTALACGVFFVSLLLKFYIVSLVGLALVVVAGFCWSWRGGLKKDPLPIDIGDGRALLPHAATRDPPSLWGMVFTLMANGTLFACLVFGYLYLRVVQAEGAASAPLVSLPWIGLGLVCVVAALGLGAASLAQRRVSAGKAGVAPLMAAIAFNALAVAALTWLVLAAGDPTQHAESATRVFTLAYVGVQAAIGALIALYAWLRMSAGYVSAMRNVETRALVLWQGWTLVTTVIAALMVGLL